MKYAQPCLCLTVVHHQQSSLKLCRSYPGNIWTFISWKRCQFIITQNVPRLWKVNPKLTSKTTLESIFDLIQSDRDLSLFTNLLYSRYSIKYNYKVRFLMGQIGEVCFKYLVGQSWRRPLGNGVNNQIWNRLHEVGFWRFMNRGKLGTISSVLRY